MLNFNIPIVVRRRSDSGMQRLEMKAVIWPGNISLPVDADIEVGDEIERTLPNGKIHAVLATEVNVLESPFGGSLDHTEVKYTTVPDAPTSEIKIGVSSNVNSKIFKKIDLQYLAAALANGVTQDQLSQFELGLSIQTSGAKTKRASAIVRHIFEEDPTPDIGFLKMLNYIYLECPDANRALSSQEYALLDKNVLTVRRICLGEDGFYIDSEPDTSAGSASSGQPSQSYLPPASPAAPDSRPIESESTVEEATSPDHIFIVHGHDEAAANKVRIKVFSWTGIMPTVLGEEAGGGGTIIEKFENIAAKSKYALVMLTPDDEGRAKNDPTSELKLRARQNVILELGYFYGSLGRNKVAVLYQGVELPSDILGVNYISYGSEHWTEGLRTELIQAGFTLKG